ncbi:MAG: hypothetical protein KAS78_01910 [Candidatus Pacebacteria bacterium]|nr:hypothetical protein [Candidatus Paceibacterota bacterium]
MELKEYAQIFKRNIKLFWLIVFLVIITGIVFQIFQPLSYKTSLNLNIARYGSQETTAYKYDEFYRLQADERFADTVVRWLESERIKTDICEDADGCFEKIKAKRLSSQLIDVTYIVDNKKMAKALADSVDKIINKETKSLIGQKESESWFVVLVSDPVIQENRIGIWKTFFISLVIGIFLGFWAVFIRHYLE